MKAYAVAITARQTSRKPIQHPKYLKFVRGLPCAVSGRTYGVESAHTGSHGLSQKASDLDAIPLHREFHTRGKYSYHVLGRVRFEQHHGVSVAAIIAETQLRAEACGILPGGRYS
jgi:Protein of unknown function (DUF968)